MRVRLFAAVAALALGAYALPGHAATLGTPNAGIASSHAVTQIACVWRHRRVHVPRHIRPNGTVVPGHWVRHRVRVCD